MSVSTRGTPGDLPFLLLKNTTLFAAKEGRVKLLEVDRLTHRRAHLRVVRFRTQCKVVTPLTLLVTTTVELRSCCVAVEPLHR